MNATNKYEQQYIDYLQSGSWHGPDAIELLDRYATSRVISSRRQLELEQLAGFHRPQSQSIVVNINHFHGCQVTIHSIGNAG